MSVLAPGGRREPGTWAVDSSPQWLGAACPILYPPSWLRLGGCRMLLRTRTSSNQRGLVTRGHLVNTVQFKPLESGHIRVQKIFHNI